MMSPIVKMVLLLGLVLWAPASARDRDKDGIPDKYDECPNEPEDMDGHEDRDGCPDPDNDGDGICDPWVATSGQAAKYANVCRGSDKCPDVAEDKDGFEDEDGCPDPDNDKDGIPDVRDKCPNDPEDFDGFQDVDGCPDPDNDNDGICDPWVMEKGLSAKYASICRLSDKCPMAPEDIDGFEDEDGCPDFDNDKDGIPDTEDKCPNEPENFNGIQDADGCPDKVFPPFKSIQTYPLIQFRTATTEIMVEGSLALENLAKQLREYPDTTVEIRVYTWYKGKGKEPYLNLLQTRSKTIVDYLVSKGVNSAQLREIEYTEEAMDSLKGTDLDFNQNKATELRLVEPVQTGGE